MKIEAIKLKDTYYTNNAPYRIRVRLGDVKPSHVDLYGFDNIPVTKNNTVKDLDGEYLILTIQSSSLFKHLDKKTIIRLQLSKGDKWIHIGDYNGN